MCMGNQGGYGGGFGGGYGQGQGFQSTPYFGAPQPTGSNPYNNYDGGQSQFASPQLAAPPPNLPNFNPGWQNFFNQQSAMPTSPMYNQAPRLASGHTYGGTPGLDAAPPVASGPAPAPAVDDMQRRRPYDGMFRPPYERG
jgi:hypothetical protein